MGAGAHGLQRPSAVSLAPENSQEGFGGPKSMVPKLFDLQGLLGDKVLWQ